MSDPVQADAGALAALLNEYEHAVQNETRQDERGAEYSTICRASNKVDATRAKVVEAFAVRLADTEDAERYRFLRDNPLQLRAIDGNSAWCGQWSAKQFDEQTDVAMLQARMEAMETDDA